LYFKERNTMYQYYKRHGIKF